MDSLETIKQNGKCCISEKPLKTSKNVNMIQLHKKATWSFPVWGNFITGEKNMAVAYVHDDCVDVDENGRLRQLKGEIKYAVELQGEEFTYHPVESLESR